MLRERIIVGGFWAFADAWFSQVFSLAVFILLARLLEPAAFGLVAMAAVVTELVADLVMAGGNRVLVQRQDLERRHVDVVFTLVLAASGLGVVVINLAAPLVASLYGAPEIAPILRWLSLALVLNGLSVVPIALLTRDMRFASLGVRSLLATVAGGSVGIAMALQGAGAFAIVGQSLAQALVGFVVLVVAARWRPRLGLSRRHLGDVGGFIVNDVGSRVVAAVNERTLPFVVGIVLGPTVVGYLGLAWRVMNLPARLLMGPIGLVLLPSLSRVQGDRSRLSAFYGSALGLSGFICYPAFLGIAAVAPELVVVAAGEKWLPAAPVLQLLAIFCLMRPPSEYGKALLFAVGEPRRVLEITAFAAVLNAAFIVVLAPHGLVAAVAGTVAVQAVGTGLVVRSVLRRTGLTAGAVLKQLAPSLAAASGMALAVAAWVRHLGGSDVSDAVTLGAGVAAGVLIYGALSVLMNRRELARSVRLVAGLIGRVRPLVGR